MKADEPTPRKRGRGADPAATKAALIDAAFTTLATDGYRGTTARSIAERAGVNQAAIYYHFSGIENLLLTALAESSQQRLDRYFNTITDTTDLVALIDQLAALYGEAREGEHLAVLTELVGGITANPELRAGIAEATEPWLSFVEQVIRDTASTYAETIPAARLVPAEDLADLVFSVVIGIELRNKLDDKVDRADRFFRLARLLAQMVGSPAKP